MSVCTGSHYTCGDTSVWSGGSTSNSALTQTINDKLSFNLGETEVFIYNRTRDFFINIADTSRINSAAFAITDEDGGNALCGDYDTTSSGSIVETYTYNTTTLNFLDARYNHAICTETIEQLTFSNSESQLAGFKNVWGVSWHHKFVITNFSINTTINYFIVLSGIKQILKTKTFTVNTYTENNPLIIVWPNPPSQAMPWINCEDIKQYGFYDYHAVGDAEGQIKIRRDGGDDFYFTDWMRLIGQKNQLYDQQLADERYFAYYLKDGGPTTQIISKPDVFIDSTPIGSIAQDSKGNIFYSVTFDGQTYNHLTDGNLSVLFPLLDNNSKFYPIGVI